MTDADVNNLLPYTKGKKFWIEIEATEDGSIFSDCPDLVKILYKDGKIDNFKVTSLVWSLSGYTDQRLLSEIRSLIDRYSF